MKMKPVRKSTVQTWQDDGLTRTRTRKSLPASKARRSTTSPSSFSLPSSPSSSPLPLPFPSPSSLLFSSNKHDNDSSSAGNLLNDSAVKANGNAQTINITNLSNGLRRRDSSSGSSPSDRKQNGNDDGNGDDNDNVNVLNALDRDSTGINHNIQNVTVFRRVAPLAPLAPPPAPPAAADSGRASISISGSGQSPTASLTTPNRRAIEAATAGGTVAPPPLRGVAIAISPWKTSWINKSGADEIPKSLTNGEGDGNGT